MAVNTGMILNLANQKRRKWGVFRRKLEGSHSPLNGSVGVYHRKLNCYVKMMFGFYIPPQMTISIVILYLYVPHTYVTPQHQMRHKSQIKKLRFWNNIIEDNTSFIMVKELCFYHN